MTHYYLELSEEDSNGSAHKFYEVDVDDCTVTINYGRIGTDGTKSVSSYGSNQEAEKQALKKVNEKKRKGYADAVKGVRQKRTITRRTIVSQPSSTKKRLPILWKYNSGAAAFGVFIDESSCWVGNQSGLVYRLNHDAEVLNQFRFAEGVKCIVADNHWIYIGCDDGNVYDLSGKIPRLAYEINEDIDIFWLDIKNGLLAVSDSGGTLTAINYENEQQWAVKTKGNSAWMVRCDEDGHIFYGDSWGVSCYDGGQTQPIMVENVVCGWSNKEAVWKQKTGYVLFGWLGKVFVYAGTGDNKVHAFSKQGQKAQTYQADNSVFSCAVSPDETYIFAGDNCSSVYCFKNTGERLWKLATGCGSAYSMQYFNEKLFIVTTDGSLACIDVSETAIQAAMEGQVTAAREVKAPTKKAELVASDVLETAPANITGVVLKCVKEGSKLRVKVVSTGYNDWYVQFPNNLRKEGRLYIVDAIEEATQGGFYRVVGNIYAQS